MEFDYYHSGTDEEFEQYFKFVRQVAEEDFELCEKAQENLERGVYGEGILNPVKENGVAFYQQKVRQAVRQQHALEKAEAEDKKADIIALNTDPREDPKALRTVSFVMKDARVWKQDGNAVGMVQVDHQDAFSW